METKPLKQRFYPRLTTGSLFTKMVQDILLVTFTFAKYSSQHGLFWAYKGEGTEPGAITFYCKTAQGHARAMRPDQNPCASFFTVL